MGYRIRVMGFNQDAAAMSGINPKTQCMLAFFISGAVAGLAGFTEINGMQHMLLTGLESDIGSYGIGIAIMANANRSVSSLRHCCLVLSRSEVLHLAILQMRRQVLLM